MILKNKKLKQTRYSLGGSMVLPDHPVAENTSSSSNTPSSETHPLTPREFWSPCFRKNLLEALQSLPRQLDESQKNLEIDKPTEGEETAAIADELVDGDWQLRTSLIRGLNMVPQASQVAALTETTLTEGKGGEGQRKGVVKATAAIALGTGITLGTVIAIEAGIAGAIGVVTLGVGLAVTLPLLVLGIVGAVFGSGYAKEYEKALNEVFPLLHEKKYDEARAKLHAQLDRDFLVRFTRYPFLKHIHYTLGYYFDGVIAESRAKNTASTEEILKLRREALKQYGLACDEIMGVKEFGATKIYLMLRLRRVSVLQDLLKEAETPSAPVAATSSSAKEAASSTDVRVIIENGESNPALPEASSVAAASPSNSSKDVKAVIKNEIDTELKAELKLIVRNFPNELKVVFYRINMKMTEYVKAFLDRELKKNVLPEEILKEINALLRLKCSSLFEETKGDEAGHGPFLLLLTTFFRAITLNYFDGPLYERIECIESETTLVLDPTQKKNKSASSSSSSEVVSPAQLRRGVISVQYYKLLLEIADFKKAYSTSSQKLKDVFLFMGTMETLAVRFFVSQVQGGASVHQVAMDHIDKTADLKKIKTNYLAENQKVFDHLKRIEASFRQTFYSYEDCIAAILDRNDLRIEEITKEKEQEKTDAFEKELIAFPASVFPHDHDKNSVLLYFENRASEKKLLREFNEKFQLSKDTFSSFKDLFAAISNEENTLITGILKGEKKGNFIQALSDLQLARLDAQLELDKQKAVAQLNARVFLINLNKKFNVNLITFQQWFEALRDLKNEVLCDIIRTRGDLLFQAFQAFPEDLRPQARELEQTLKISIERYFVTQLLIINNKLEFKDFESCIQALLGKVEHAGLTQFIGQEVVNDKLNDNLIALIDKFPELHPDKKRLQSSVLRLKQVFLVEKLNRILGISLINRLINRLINLSDCVLIIRNRDERVLAKLGISCDSIKKWISNLAEVGFTSEEIRNIENQLEECRFLLSLRTGFELKYSDISIFLHDVYDLKEEIQTVIQNGKGRKLYAKLEELKVLGISLSGDADYIERMYKSLMKAILLYEFKRDLDLDMRSLDSCFSLALKEEEGTDIRALVFEKNRGEVFLKWLLSIPADEYYISPNGLKKIYEKTEERFLLFNLNREFSLNFESIDDWLSAIRSKNTRIIPLLENNEKLLKLINYFNKTPERYSTKNEIIQTLTDMFVLNDLENEFEMSFTDLQRAVLTITVRLIDAKLRNVNENVNKISRITHKTLLHWLASLKQVCSVLPEQVRTLAEQLIDLRYVRDNQNQTAEVLLKKNDDPFQISGVLISNNPQSNVEQLQQVKNFLDRVRRGGWTGNQLILLEGPPGTGKTTLVVEYLKKQSDCVVTEWIAATTDDRYLNQAEARIIQNFSEIAQAVEEDPQKIQILFIDEMDTVCSAISGTLTAAHHDPQRAVAEFQKQIDKIKNTKVVVIGATNFPERIAEAILNRAAQRVVFSLPDCKQRENLLSYFFREHIIPEAYLPKLASITTGWSPRQLENIVQRLSEVEHLDEPCIQKAFQQVSSGFERQFNKEHDSVELKLPVFKLKEEENPLDHLEGVDEDVVEEFKKIMNFLKHSENYDPIFRMHALLHGEPGGGKTFTIKQLLAKANLPYLVVRPDICSRDVSELARAFVYAQQFHPALMFIDEIDMMLSRGGEAAAACLQVNMDGNSEGAAKMDVVVLAATNHSNLLSDAIRSRFVLTLEVRPLSLQMRAGLIAQTLRDYLSRGLRMAADLERELDTGCFRLSNLAEGLEVRSFIGALNFGLGASISENAGEELFAVTFEDVAGFIRKVYEQNHVVRQTDFVAPIEETSSSSSFYHPVTSTSQSVLPLVQRFGLYNIHSTSNTAPDVIAQNETFTREAGASI